MANTIESRITKLEDRIGIGQKAETLDEMIAKFDRYEYGQAKVMSVVVAMRDAKDEKAMNTILEHYPQPLAECFFDGFRQAIKEIIDGVPGQGVREKRPDESEADFLKYKIGECIRVVGGS